MSHPRDHRPSGLPGGFLNPSPLGPYGEAGSGTQGEETPAPLGSPDSGLSSDALRSAIAHMSVLGATPERIALELGISFLKISGILAEQRTSSKIKQVQEDYLGANLKKRIARSIPKALKAFEDIIEGNVPAKTSEMLSAAQWMLEKHDGKPQQSTTVDAGAGIMQLLSALDSMKNPDGAQVGPGSSGPVIDVTPQKVKGKFDDWVSANVPVLSADKKELK